MPGLTVSKLLVGFHLDSTLLSTLQTSEDVFVLLLVVLGAQTPTFTAALGLLLPSPSLLLHPTTFFLERNWLMLGRVVLLIIDMHRIIIAVGQG